MILNVMPQLATVHPKIYKLNLHTFKIPICFLHMGTIAIISKGRAVCPPPPGSLRVKLCKLVQSYSLKSYHPDSKKIRNAHLILLCFWFNGVSRFVHI